MTQKKLTNAYVNSLKPKSKRYELIDSVLPNFRLRITPTGVKTYSVMYRNRFGQKKRYTIGVHGIITATQARTGAKAILGKVASNEDPQQTKKDNKQRADNSPPTLLDFIDGEYGDFVEHNRRDGTKTIKRIKSAFPDFLNGPIDKIIPWNIEKWRSARHKAKIKPATTDREIAGLKSVLSHAVSAGYLTANPLTKFKLTRPDNRRIRYLSKHEEKALRKVISYRKDYLKPLILLAMNTGARRGELFNLTWENVNLSRKQMTVVAHTAKSAKTRHIPLNKEAIKVLREWKQKNLTGLVFPGKEGKSLNTIKTAWAGILQKAKIQDFTFHDLRHHFASRLVMAGTSLILVRDLLGHESIKMTERYSHLAPDEKAKAVEKLTA